MSEKLVKIEVKKPSECTGKELQDFAALVLLGGEVSPNGLDERIRKAEALVFFSQDSCLKGIAAIKKPEQIYKNRVFQKAQACVRANNFYFELGWIYLEPSLRGRGFSHKIVQAALCVKEEQSIFATSRVENIPMHKVLSAHGFSCQGNAYPSNLGEKTLVLFIKN